MDTDHQSARRGWFLFIELDTFHPDWERLGLGDDDLLRLQASIVASPVSHPVVPGAGGVRKVRFADPPSNRGKRGSFRIYYGYYPAYGVVVLLAAFGKNEKSDLSPADKRAIADLVGRFGRILDDRRSR